MEIVKKTKYVIKLAPNPGSVPLNVGLQATMKSSKHFQITSIKWFPPIITKLCLVLIVPLVK